MIGQRRFVVQPIRPMPTETMNRPGPGDNFPAVQSALWDYILHSGADRNPLPGDNQRIAALDHEHVFIEVMNVGGMRRIRGTSRRLSGFRPRHQRRSLRRRVWPDLSLRSGSPGSS